MAKNALRIGLVMKSLQGQFMAEGARAFAQTRRASFTLHCVGTDSQTDVERQLHLIDELAAQDVDGLVVVPIDSRALVAPVVRAATW